MKSYTQYLFFNTSKKIEYKNITSTVDEIVKKSGVSEGFVLVSAMHITAAVIVNDEETGLKADILEWLDGLAPMDHAYRHHLTGEVNGGAHLRNLLLGHQQILPITDGTLDLGPWEQIFYLEFDGQRRKRVVVKVLGY